MRSDWPSCARSSSATCACSPSARAWLDARLDEYRWLLEELRVSLFAQELRTPQPVSVKRLDKVWSHMLALSTPSARRFRRRRFGYIGLRRSGATGAGLVGRIRLEQHMGIIGMIVIGFIVGSGRPGDPAGHAGARVHPDDAARHRRLVRRRLSPARLLGLYQAGEGGRLRRFGPRRDAAAVHRRQGQGRRRSGKAMNATPATPATGSSCPAREREIEAVARHCRRLVTRRALIGGRRRGRADARPRLGHRRRAC